MLKIHCFESIQIFLVLGSIEVLGKAASLGFRIVHLCRHLLLAFIVDAKYLGQLLKSFLLLGSFAVIIKVSAVVERVVDISPCLKRPRLLLYTLALVGLLSGLILCLGLLTVFHEPCLFNQDF